MSVQVPPSLRSWKLRAKRLRHRLRNAYFNRFHSFTPEDFRQALRQVGAQPSDVLCVHSSFDQFLGFRGNANDALKSLQDVVGNEGGLMMPTQPFTGTAIDYVREHAITDLRRAPSLMGLLTELLRRSPGVARSINPTHPVAAWGDKGMRLLGNDWEAATPCGKNTAYHRLLECDGKILTLGTWMHAITFYHCVEEMIEPLMPFSPFTSETFTLQTRDANGGLYTSHMRLFEPKLSARRHMGLLIPELKRQGFWKEARVGRLEIILLRAADVLEASLSMARKGQYCYLQDATGAQ